MTGYFKDKSPSKYPNYSRPNQKHERVFVRTENVKEKNAIGEITWSDEGFLDKVKKKFR